MLTNPVLLSVIIMAVLSLAGINVMFALIIAALSGGLLSGMGILESATIMIEGMGGAAETALSYVLLGALAFAIGKTGAADILARKIGKVIKDTRVMFVLIIAGIASLSQNLIPVHIAFIPILIPPLIGVMNKLKIDRRAVACALTFGLKAPYLALPVGFGLQFHKIVTENVVANGMPAAEVSMVWKAMLMPAAGMVIGLLIAVFISYRKPRDYEDKMVVIDEEHDDTFTIKHFGALVGAVIAFAIQLKYKSLPLAALAGVLTMIPFGSFKFKEMNEVVDGGIKIMGFIAFVMLVASGFGDVIRATGGVEELVNGSVNIIGGSKVLGAFMMLIIGLIITLGIGTSFGTIPVLATIFVPLAMQLGFSIPATMCLLGTAGALGDAGSPASDSTLGPTSGLNVDGQHDHIWDTVVPTFLHYNIPLIIMGTIGALVL
ncbi:MAG: Na+/H+ antiporter family protein [Tissierella sp.]|uniref:Na+/H+ antiporter family protein n=1 Tax=Tissierella sp. TaxID=41274 RepID=UPI003F948A6A